MSIPLFLYWFRGIYMDWIIRIESSANLCISLNMIRGFYG